MSRRRRHREDDFGGGESWLTRLFQVPGRFLGRWFGGDQSLERAGRDEPLWMTLLLFLPRSLGAFFDFLINDWSSSRRGSAFLFALPALGAVGLLVAILSVAAWKLETSRFGFYSGRLSFYQQAEDPEFARSCALKLVELKPTAQNKYKLALAMRELDDFQAAFDLMVALAPDNKVRREVRVAELAKEAQAERAAAGEKRPAELERRMSPESESDDRELAPELSGGAVPEVADPAAGGAVDDLVYTGYAPAHLWLADLAAFGTDWQLSSEERKQQALVHYSAAYELAAAENSPESIYASLRLAELQIQDGQLDAAEQTLRTATSKPVATLLHLQAIAKLIAVLKQQDKLPEIKANASVLQPRLFRLASEMPDVIEPWQALIDVASQAGNYQEADDYIQSALAMAKEPGTRRSLLQLRAAVLMRRAVQMKSVDEEERYLEKFGYLAMALGVDPTNDKLYLAMLEYVDLNEQNPQEDDFIRLALGSGKTPGVAHVILGIRDAQRNEKLAAFYHWDIADTQTDRAEWLVGMFSRLLLQAKGLDSTGYFRFLDICQEHYRAQPMLKLARAEALLLLQQDATSALPLLEQMLAENGDFLAAREAYVLALKALGRGEEAERETLKLKEMTAEIQRLQAKSGVGKEEGK